MADTVRGRYIRECLSAEPPMVDDLTPDASFGTRGARERRTD
jgi:hypothetical protein